MTDDVRGGHYVDGEWRGGSGETFESRNPATGATIGTFEEASDETVDAALAAAESAFEEWRSLSYPDRAEYLWEVYAALRERTDELGAIVTRECGKEISEGRADVTEAAHMVEWAAGNARHPHGDVVPSEIAAKDSSMRRKPRGVTGCITPWNFPIAIPFWHMAVALVEGNTVVWKPAEQTPYCGEVVAELFAEAGIPDGVFNLVQGHGAVGEQIVADDRPATILFTGSASVGHAIADAVADRSGVRAACEMGGKNAIVVTANADLELAIHSAVVSSFKTTGQRCVSSERLIVHTDVYEEFRERFVEVAEHLLLEDPLSGDAFMGPLVDADQVETVRRYNELARKEAAATVLVDRAEVPAADRPKGHEEGHWVGPFVYEMPASEQAEHALLNEEVFGPHVALVEYEGGIERAVELQNDTPYGLAGAIVSEDYRELHYYRDNADLGLAYGNLPSIGAEVQLPFGGVKRSGNGWPSAREIIEAVTDRTAWTLNNDRDVELAQGLSADIATRQE